MKKVSLLKLAALSAVVVCTLFACTKNNESVPVPATDQGVVGANSIIGTNGIIGGGKSSADTSASSNSIIGTNGIIGGGK